MLSVAPRSHVRSYIGLFQGPEGAFCSREPLAANGNLVSCLNRRQPKSSRRRIRLLVSEASSPLHRPGGSIPNFAFPSPSLPQVYINPHFLLALSSLSPKPQLAASPRLPFAVVLIPQAPSQWSTGAPPQRLLPTIVRLRLRLARFRFNQSRDSRVHQVHARALRALHVNTVRGGSQRRPDLFSFCSWEFVVSIDFDWQFISGKKKFRWPLVRLVGPEVGHALR